ncbi:FimV/HubP family polar landmark protein, partial [Paraglaciecola sp.]|uniref:FimV/HubP family polar landmark protein n=1 Tax=Paraglaciecola sp. TaxID=1920173 RepID=UPI00273D608D
DEFAEHNLDEHGLDEDELEKALEDFEHQELDEVLKDLTSDQKGGLDSLDELEFGAIADDYFQHKAQDPSPNQDETDDSLLEQALADLDAEAENLSEVQDESALDEFPGLGDWLSQDKELDPKDKKDKQLQSNAEDESVLDEIEEANFDELLDAIDISNDDENDGLDISALLSEPTAEDEVVSNELLNNTDEDDFLDVEALLNDSFDEEEDSLAAKDLDLSAPLASFFGDPTEGEGVDVDDDSGFGAKLDLAHAYIEIGEHDSAVELLQDIIENGSEQQVIEAKSVLANLAE